MRPIAAVLSLVLVLAFATSKPATAQHQTIQSDKPAATPAAEAAKLETVESSNIKFRRSLLAAANKSAKAGKLKRRQVLSLRVSTLSPAFLDAAKQVCVSQMFYSGVGEEFVPMTDDGKVNMEGIDWDSFADFLERIIPIVLQLIEIFGK